jgi:fructosamine-3-kinase
MVDPRPDLALSRGEATRLLQLWLGDDVRCTGVQPLAGGMVNSVHLLDFDRPPHRAVVKLHDRDDDTFSREASALEHLRTQTDCPVPAVHLHDSSARHLPYSFLLLEHVPGVCLDSVDLPPADRAGVDRQLATVLAGLHERTGEGWGAPGAVDRSSSWADVFGERLAEVRARPTVAERLTPAVLARVDRAIELTPTMLDEPDAPRLVHGDVWDGNVIVRREDGRWVVAALLDPDLQFADAELEIAYLEVFDTSQAVFLEEYTEHHALRPGYARRRLVYWLHTALVHVALFEDRYFRDFTARTAEQIVQLHD